MGYFHFSMVALHELTRVRSHGSGSARRACVPDHGGGGRACDAPTLGGGRAVTRMAGLLCVASLIISSKLTKLATRLDLPLKNQTDRGYIYE
jgi:hypothetical protein